MHGIAADAVRTAFAFAEVVLFLSWVLFFAVLILFYALVLLGRKRRVTSGPRATGVARAAAAARAGLARSAAAGRPPAGLDALHRADPRFDEQLLLDAARTATMLMFVATATGDEAPISRVVTESFWQTTHGRVVHTAARDRRSGNDIAAESPGGSKARQQNVPVDYQASAAELTAVQLGNEQQVCVRVAYGELFAIVRPGAAAFAAGATASSLTSGFISMARAIAVDASGSQQAAVAWVGADGHYDLAFVRPAGLQTDPAAALADRTCPTCGATYRSELATACQHCGTERPMPWGQWRLASAVPAL
jgi:hypothetical protein